MPRKRPLDVSLNEELLDERPPNVKRRRTISPQYSSFFWDQLSRIRHTRGALKELERRAADQSNVRAGTRGRTTARRLLRSDVRSFQELASRGGPDLSSVQVSIEQVFAVRS